VLLNYFIDESRQPLATNQVEVTPRPLTACGRKRELDDDQQSHHVLATVKRDRTFEAGRGTRTGGPHATANAKAPRQKE
jgi:hypothetical protein